MNTQDVINYIESRYQYLMKTVTYENFGELKILHKLWLVLQERNYDLCWKRLCDEREVKRKAKYEKEKIERDKEYQKVQDKLYGKSKKK